jgi:hypothetical protein
MKTTNHYNTSSPEEMEMLYKKFPRTREIAMSGLGEEAQAQMICNYLSNHWAKAWVSNQGLVKTETRKALIAAATAAAIGIVGIADQALAAKFGTQPEDKFLWTIMQIESSNGKDTNHRLMKTGIHAGQHAMGRWGLMPKTVAEVEKRFKLAKTFPILANVNKLDNQELNDFFSEHPNAELIVARALARHIIRIQDGNMAKASYAWLHGHNLTPDRITVDLLKSSDYVQKFAKNSDLNPFKTQTEREKFKNKMKGWLEVRAEKRQELLPDPHKGFDRGYSHEEDKTPTVKDRIVALINRKED